MHTGEGGADEDADGPGHGRRKSIQFSVDDGLDDLRFVVVVVAATAAADGPM